MDSIKVNNTTGGRSIPATELPSTPVKIYNTFIPQKNIILDFKLKNTSQNKPSQCQEVERCGNIYLKSSADVFYLFTNRLNVF